MGNGIYFLWQSSQQQPLTDVVTRGSSEPVGGNPLQLLSELAPSAAGDRRARAEVSELPVVTDLTSATPSPAASGNDLQKPRQEIVAPTSSLTDSPAMCWLIGPFKEPVSAKQVVARMAALDIVLPVKTIELKGKPDYWVHIPPRPTRKEAVGLLRQLQADNIDSFLITEGDLANGISLGFFTRQSSAQKLNQRRQTQGYDVQIKVVPRVRSQLWLLYDVQSYGEFTQILWKKVQQGNNGLERHKNSCDRIASADYFD